MSTANEPPITLRFDLTETEYLVVVRDLWMQSPLFVARRRAFTRRRAAVSGLACGLCALLIVAFLVVPDAPWVHTYRTPCTIALAVDVLLIVAAIIMWTTDHETSVDVAAARKARSPVARGEQGPQEIEISNEGIRLSFRDRTIFEKWNGASHLRQLSASLLIARHDGLHYIVPKAAITLPVTIESLTERCNRLIEAANRDDYERVSTFLSNHDAVCPHCHYGLRGTAKGVCPECGWRLSRYSVPEAFGA